jgi:hypothetical protein
MPFELFDRPETNGEAGPQVDPKQLKSLTTSQLTEND